MKLIIGLGNPGARYAQTRHNLGWLVLDELAAGGKWREDKKAQCYFLSGQMSGQEIGLVKPTTFMNNSGPAVSYILQKHYLKSPDIMVVHDDKDLDFGEIRVAADSSSAGHNGVQSIIDALGSQKFLRVRVGVKDELLDKMETDKFVLSKFTAEEMEALPGVIMRVIAEIERNIK